jgi:hypothetical protein
VDNIMPPFAENTAEAQRDILVEDEPHGTSAKS